MKNLCVKLIISQTLVDLVRSNECHSCLYLGKTHCISPTSWSTGTCCEKDDKRPICNDNMYCASETTITNEWTRLFVCPSDPANCPTSNLQLTPVEGQATTKTFAWPTVTVPTLYAYAWHCKYQIVGSSKEGDQDYLHITINNNGFDEYADLLV